MEVIKGTFNQLLKLLQFVFMVLLSPEIFPKPILNVMLRIVT